MARRVSFCFARKITASQSYRSTLNVSAGSNAICRRAALKTRSWLRSV